MNYLSKEAIIEINRKVTALSSDPFGVQNLANLEYLVSAVQYKYNDKPIADQLVLKAAFILDLIANKGHVFIEGNKRTAITSTLTFLEDNDIILSDLEQKELVKFVLSVASGNESISSASKWLSERIKRAK